MSTREANTTDWADRFRALEDTDELLSRAAEGAQKAHQQLLDVVESLLNRVARLARNVADHEQQIGALEERVRVLEGRNGEHSEGAAGEPKRCGATTVSFGTTFVCSKDAGHDDDHGGSSNGFGWCGWLRDSRPGELPLDVRACVSDALIGTTGGMKCTVCKQTKDADRHDPSWHLSHCPVALLLKYAQPVRTPDQQSLRPSGSEQPEKGAGGAGDA